MNNQIGIGKILIGAVVIAIVCVAGLIGARMVLAPSFAAVDGDYRYQWHRVTNEQEWKDIKVKHRGNQYCKDCHADQSANETASVHAKVQCENCHGPAVDHPENPAKLTLDKSRTLCLRCHSGLPYRTAKYAELPKGEVQLKMVNPDEHNPDMECVTCHDPHKAALK
jgi:predicted CXXCH cytochrome family protein